MPINIKDIYLTQGKHKDNPMEIVKIEFAFPCEWTYLNIDDLKKILELWIIGEEKRYPQSKGFKGRWLLFDEIKKVFDETKEEEVS